MGLKSTVVSIVAVVVTVAVAIGGCTNAGSGGGGSSSSPEYSVPTAGLNGEATESDFSGTLEFNGGKNEAFIVAFMGLASAGQFSEEYVAAQLYADPNWRPSTGAVSMTPTDPQQIPTAENIAISGSLSEESLVLQGGEDLSDNETVNFSGTAIADASANLEAVQDPSNNGPEELTVTGDATADFDLSDGITYDTDNEMPDLLGGAIHLAANLDGAADPDYDSDGFLYELLVEYAVSARLSAAVSVQGAKIEAGQYEGHFLVTFSYDDNVLLDITNSLLGNESALADYIEEKVSTDFTLTIDVYDRDGSSVANRYTYDAAYLKGMLQ